MRKSEFKQNFVYKKNSTGSFNKLAFNNYRSHDALRLVGVVVVEYQQNNEVLKRCQNIN